jgi:hypothetical protein
MGVARSFDMQEQGMCHGYNMIAMKLKHRISSGDRLPVRTGGIRVRRLIYRKETLQTRKVVSSGFWGEMVFANLFSQGGQ